jgi:hypothetical protein
LHLAECLHLNGTSYENPEIFKPIGPVDELVAERAASVGREQRNHSTADPSTGLAGSNDTHAAVV